MATDKVKLIKGIYFFAFAFPFYFIGPTLYYLLGGPGLQKGEWIWAAVSIILMFLAVALTIRAIAVILDAFFDKK